MIIHNGQMVYNFRKCSYQNETFKSFKIWNRVAVEHKFCNGS